MLLVLQNGCVCRIQLYRIKKEFSIHIQYKQQAYKSKINNIGAVLK